MAPHNMRMKGLDPTSLRGGVPLEAAQILWQQSRLPGTISVVLRSWLTHVIGILFIWLRHLLQPEFVDRFVFLKPTLVGAHHGDLDMVQVKNIDCNL